MMKIQQVNLKKGGITKASLPEGAVVLSSQHTIHGTIIWFLAHPNATKTARLFYLHPTEAKLPDSIADARFITTLTVNTAELTPQGIRPRTLVDHLWELPLHVAKEVKAMIDAKKKGGN